MKLNLGCGFRKNDGWVNVDRLELCKPDVVCDLAHETWPWVEAEVEEAQFIYSLEQMGLQIDDLFHVLKELYRVCKPDAKITIVYAHPRHDQFVFNPMNRHRLSPDFFSTFDVQQNLIRIGNGQSDDCLGLQLGVNFSVLNLRFLLSREIHEQLEKGELTEEIVRHRMQYENNICQAHEIHLRVVKSPHG